MNDIGAVGATRRVAPSMPADPDAGLLGVGWNGSTGASDNSTRAVSAANAAQSVAALRSMEADPAAGYAVIQPGNTLGELAATRGLSLRQLLDLNPQIEDPNRIQAGDRINLALVAPAARPAPIDSVAANGAEPGPLNPDAALLDLGWNGRTGTLSDAEQVLAAARQRAGMADAPPGGTSIEDWAAADSASLSVTSSIAALQAFEGLDLKKLDPDVAALIAQAKAAGEGGLYLGDKSFSPYLRTAGQTASMVSELNLAQQELDRGNTDAATAHLLKAGVHSALATRFADNDTVVAGLAQKLGLARFADDGRISTAVLQRIPVISTLFDKSRLVTTDGAPSVGLALMPLTISATVLDIHDTNQQYDAAIRAAVDAGDPDSAAMLADDKQRAELAKMFTLGQSAAIGLGPGPRLATFVEQAADAGASWASGRTVSLPTAFADAALDFEDDPLAAQIEEIGSKRPEDLTYSDAVRLPNLADQAASEIMKDTLVNWGRQWWQALNDPKPGSPLDTYFDVQIRNAEIGMPPM